MLSQNLNPGILVAPSPLLAAPRQFESSGAAEHQMDRIGCVSGAASETPCLRSMIVYFQSSAVKPFARLFICVAPRSKRTAEKTKQES